MKKLAIHWTPMAKIQYSEVITFWIEKTETISYVEKVQKEVAYSLELLSEFPKMCPIFPKRSNKDIRQLIILTNYSIFYRIIEDKEEIEIVLFWDNRTNPKKLRFN